MKKFALFFLSLLVLFAMGFAVSRIAPRVMVLLGEEQGEKWLDGGFSPAMFPIENHPFAIVVIGRNNGAFLEKTLKSVFSQKYENYRVIYIDDASSDGSFEMARDLIYGSEQMAQVTLVRNEEKLGQIANLVRAVESCKGEEIVVVLDGEDRLAHEWVLQRLNQYYADPDLWLTYGQYREYPSYKLGQSKAYSEGDWKEKGFRAAPLSASHLKSFYAALFKKIRESDLIYQGQYMRGELPYMIPLLEMAKDHFQFIPEVLYLSTSSPREDRELQARIEKQVRSQERYAPVASLLLSAETDIEAEGEL